MYGAVSPYFTKKIEGENRLLDEIMNSRERSLIEKAAAENGWEYIVERTETVVTF